MKLYKLWMEHYDYDQFDSMIDNGKIQTTDIEWGEPEYECFSFGTTGDVDGHC